MILMLAWKMYWILTEGLNLQRNRGFASRYGRKFYRSRTGRNYYTGVEMMFLPTGRNFYTLDPEKVPTKAAWEVGKRLADSVIQKI